MTQDPKQALQIGTSPPEGSTPQQEKPASSSSPSQKPGSIGSDLPLGSGRTNPPTSLSEYRTGRWQTVNIMVWVVGSVVSLGLLLYFTLRQSGGPVGPTKPQTSTPGDNSLLMARSALAKQGDLTTCRLSLGQINTHVARTPEHQAPSAASGKGKELAEQLRSLFGLQDDELAEVLSVTYTSLDAYHLESCFLLRDVARSLELPPAPGKPGNPAVVQTPLERATLAFDWVVRQIRLQPVEGEAIPPVFTLRRGYGSSLERALVFLGILEQFGQDEEAVTGLQGCLLFCPGPSGPRLWACGVAIGSKPDALYLFDPRLGLPLPGPDGKGVATLAQVQKDPTVLGQLKPTPAPQRGEKEAVAYDVTSEQAKSAEVKFVCPLSALAPRMEILQNVLFREQRWQDASLGSPIRVRLAEDPTSALKSLRQAVVAGGGKESDVSVWPAATGLLRRFLPPEDGGTDPARPMLLSVLRGFTVENDPFVAQFHRKQLYRLQAVPWENFPAGFRDPEVFRYDTELGQRVRDIYAGPFMSSLGEGETPRNLLLRGRSAKAKQELVKELERWQTQQERRANAQNLVQHIREWVPQAIAAYAQDARARTSQEKQAARQALDTLWKRGDAVILMLTSAAADSWVPELTWQIALCTFDRAERLQARVDLANRGKGASLQEQDAVKQEWEDARNWWSTYTRNYPHHPGHGLARRFQARTLARLGEQKAAISLLQDLSGPLSELDKVAQLWLAKQFAEDGKGKE